MIDLSHYVLYDAARTLRLSLEPVPRGELLRELPGELVVSSLLLAFRLGCEATSVDVMTGRAAEFAELDEESAFRLWENPVAAADGRTVFVSAPDSLPDVAGAPDFGLASAGFLIGGTAEILDWVMSVTDAEDADEARLELSRLLSGTGETPHAVRLTECATGAVLQRWPVRCGNPLRALTASARSWPEVRYAEDDFTFTLKSDLAEPAAGA